MRLVPLALLAVLAASALPAAAQTPGDTLAVVIRTTAFPADGAGAPLSLDPGDTAIFERTEDAPPRYLIYVRGEIGGELYRTDAAHFGIERPDPWAVELSATPETRYAHGRVNVRSGAGTTNAQVAQLGRDDFVWVHVCHAGWCRVEATGSADGWSEGYVSESLLHDGPSPAALAAYARSGRSYSSGSSSPRTDPRTCASFATESAAQAAYDADPVGLRHLDRDGDGDACESTWRPRTVSTRRARPATTRTCYTGPRGGRYYINSNGNKTYGC